MLGPLFLTSAAHGFGAWKDSTLTLFFHAASGDRDTRDRATSLDTADAMPKAASTMKTSISMRDQVVIEVD